MMCQPEHVQRAMNTDKSDNSQKDSKPKASRPKQQQRRRPQQDNGQDRPASKDGQAKKHYYKRKPKTTDKKEEPAADAKQEEKHESSDSDNDSEASGDLCVICTEPIVTYAVGDCDHRTCHLCALRLRALYDTKNCALCKAEQTTVIFTKDAEKPFQSYSEKDAPLVDKKLGLRFEDKQVQQDTMLLLQYNCPDPDCDVACDGGWAELKRHVRKTHERTLCDLCTRHKKIFVHEHTLFTYPQLQKHIKSGDKSFNPNDDTGFKGHPECFFCKVNFYDDDALFEHCRDKHEQCHICVRQGVKHEYYADYDRLEEHFKKDHYLCVYRECLDRKFVVFDTDIDLKAHEVEEHGGSITRLQRAKQSEARRVDVSFDYGSNSRSQYDNRGRRHRRNDDEPPQQAPPPAPPAQPVPRTNTLNDADFPGIGGQPAAQQQRSSSSSSSSTNKRQQKSTFRKPAGYGALSDNWPTLGQSATSESGSSSAQKPRESSSSSSSSSTSAAPEVVSRHAAFMERVFDMFKSHDKLARFRSLTTAYRNSSIDAETYVNEIVDLCDGNTDNASKIFKGVEDLIDSEEKKWEILRTWRNKHTAINNFPALESPGGPTGHGTSSRVLVIKSRNTKAGGTRTTGKSKAGVWDRVASAASGASNVSPRSSPHSSRPSSPAPASFPTPNISGPRTAWAGGRAKPSGSQEQDFPSLGKQPVKPAQHFPSLPSAPKRQPLASMRRNASNTQLNAWGGERSFDTEVEPAAEDHQKSKKKGKKKQVLLRVGL